MRSLIVLLVCVLALGLSCTPKTPESVPGKPETAAPANEVKPASTPATGQGKIASDAAVGDLDGFQVNTGGSSASTGKTEKVPEPTAAPK